MNQILLTLVTKLFEFLIFELSKSFVITNSKNAESVYTVKMIIIPRGWRISDSKFLQVYI